MQLLSGPAHVAACSYAIQGAAKHAPATVLAGQQLVRVLLNIKWQLHRRTAASSFLSLSSAWCRRQASIDNIPRKRSRVMETESLRNIIAVTVTAFENVTAVS